MALTQLEEHLVAYYLLRDAKRVFVNDRYCPRKDIVKIYKDSIRISVGHLDKNLDYNLDNVAVEIVNRLVEAGGIKVTQDKYTGESLQFNILDYKKSVQKLIDADPLLETQESFDPDYWQATISSLQ